jgi:phage gpG-like protein
MIKAHVKMPKKWEVAEKRIVRIIQRTNGKDKTALQEVQKIAFSEVATVFAMQGNPRWQHRSQAYEERMLKKYGRLWPILAKTGALLRTVLDDLRANWIRRDNRWVLPIHSPLSEEGYPYGRAHQYGLGVPKRPFISFSRSAKDAMKRALKNIVKNGR